MDIISTIKDRSGQTLVTLLVFIVVATAVTSTAVAVLINTTRSSSIIGESITATQIADSGAENALLRLLRDPNYTGETLTVGNGTATITVSGSNPKTINSVGKIGDFQKTVQVVVTYNSTMSVTSWSYVY